jgi:hypothetical protein
LRYTDAIKRDGESIVLVDTLGLVGATSRIHTSVSIDGYAPREVPRAVHRHSVVREARQQTRVT